MPSSRRAFVVATATALAGCTWSAGESEPRTDADVETASRDRDPNTWSFDEPFVWWSWLPDITVLNHDTDSVTADVAVRPTPWLAPSFRETVSLRGRAPDEPPISTSISNVETDSPRSVLVVTTATGIQDVHDYHSGGRKRAIAVHFHGDHFDFTTTSPSRTRR